MIYNVSDGESLLIHRIRRGYTQQQAADESKLTRKNYGFLERDSEVRDDELDLEKNEICLVLRRRRGKTQKECAEQLGITRYWFNQMEIGKAPVDTLANFWGV